VKEDFESNKDSESSSDCSESSETCWTSEVLLGRMHATVVAEKAIANLVITNVSVSRVNESNDGRERYVPGCYKVILRLCLEADVIVGRG